MYGREELKMYWCGKFDVYDKYEADSVMDAMERRIARLKALVEGWKKNSLVLGETYHKRLAQEQARIKELEATISKMETTQKWISVEDVLPQWGKLVKIKFKDGKEDERRFSADYKWVSKGMQTCESVNVTHWMPLPDATTTEEI